ncbi:MULTISPECIES: class I SAM-dependent methyltransferase [Aeromicrobium]|uniref:class I SAM-dependent methyltransferase n=1 Tax=Aeromicrobium TaxID=2040 RepID=UPI00257B1176|nr:MULTISPECIES: class I SAM-dependent methyltransferase [Aeromicrobium]
MARAADRLDAPQERDDYWNAYYADRGVARPLPSQFAAFVAGELDQPARIIEFGSGSGRDTLFFAAHGHDVTGVDASKAAVEACTAEAADLGLDVEFLAATIDQDGLAAQLRVSPGTTVVYARFFVHAITDEEQTAFLDLAASLTSPGDRLAVEYRTLRDSSGAKVTGSHFRRFVDPTSFNAEAVLHGFDVTYAVEGFGFAKYRQDDAYVARALFLRR